jgi:hypothetical protein
LKADWDVEFDRCFMVDNPISVELHGFSDASETAFGACIYIVCKNSSGEVKSQLICAKSKVDPIEKETLPRLELMGAVILSELYQKVISLLRLNVQKAFLWSDSMIVLCWLRMNENRLQQFVRNRVFRFQKSTVDCIWGHVPTILNPADLVSRGVFPQDIVNSSLWWHGPEYISKDQSE